MQPFVVEIVGGSSWWKDWLPLFSSVIVAAVAFRGVVLSNRTNSRAIERADAREHTKWQREALLNLCSESIERALVVQNGYAKMVFLPVPVEQEKFDAALKNLEGQGNASGLTRQLSACSGHQRLQVRVSPCVRRQTVWLWPLPPATC
ncbi:hypothetical protein ACGF5S_17435 [Nocardia nova]|uniref:hypothetical protein n=1 Tax=Nocardia nova TaxID=37330 RepID=UPI003717E7A4